MPYPEFKEVEVLSEDALDWLSSEGVYGHKGCSQCGVVVVQGIHCDYCGEQLDD